MFEPTRIQTRVIEHIALDIICLAAGGHHVLLHCDDSEGENRNTRNEVLVLIPEIVNAIRAKTGKSCHIEMTKEGLKCTPHNHNPRLRPQTGQL